MSQMPGGGNIGQDRQKAWIPIAVAVIGAAAVIIAAVVTGLFANQGSPGSATPSSVEPSSPSRVDVRQVCVPGDRRYQAAQLN